MSVVRDVDGETQESRRAPRAPVTLKADLREAGASGNRIKVDLLDISVSGFRFTSESNVTIGMRAFLTVPGMSGQLCSVAWRRDWTYGARFDEPLYPAVRDHIAARFPKR